MLLPIFYMYFVKILNYFQCSKIVGLHWVSTISLSWRHCSFWNEQLSENCNKIFNYSAGTCLLHAQAPTVRDCLVLHLMSIPANSEGLKKVTDWQNKWKKCETPRSVFGLRPSAKHFIIIRLRPRISFRCIPTIYLAIYLVI